MHCPHGVTVTLKISNAPGSSSVIPTRFSVNTASIAELLSDKINTDTSTTLASFATDVTVTPICREYAIRVYAIEVMAKANRG